jgi:hydrogenase-4 component E
MAGRLTVSPLLIALLGVLLLPLFVATWRTSLAGLSCQGFLMAWIAYRMAPPVAASDWLTMVDLVLVRGLWAPIALYGVLRANKAPSRNDVIPPNLLSWSAALAMVMVAFSFAEVLVPESGQQQTLIAVATSGVLLGFLVLATQSGPFSQMIGVLRLENGIALFELGGEHHHEALALRIGQIAVVVLGIALYRRYLAVLSTTAAPPDAVEGPTL